MGGSRIRVEQTDESPLGAGTGRGGARVFTDALRHSAVGAYHVQRYTRLAVEPQQKVTVSLLHRLPRVDDKNDAEEVGLAAGLTLALAGAAVAALRQVRAHRRLPALHLLLGRLRKAVPRQVHQLRAHRIGIKVERARHARPVGNGGQTNSPFVVADLAGQRVEQARFAHVGPAGKRNFRQRPRRQLVRRVGRLLQTHASEHIRFARACLLLSPLLGHLHHVLL